jgi:hypothetical protein
MIEWVGLVQNGCGDDFPVAGLGVDPEVRNALGGEIEAVRLGLES